MRPRPEGRGEHTPARATAIVMSFNAATARRPWRTADTRVIGPHVELQCGHGPKAVENRRAWPDSCESTGGFNAATARRPWRTACSRRRVRRKAGFNAATARRPWRTAVITGRAGRVGFNAATARRPWRTPRQRCSRFAVRSFNAATARRPWRTDAGGAECPQVSRCFNAATARRPWRTCHPGGDQCRRR